MVESPFRPSVGRRVSAFLRLSGRGRGLRRRGLTESGASESDDLSRPRAMTDQHLPKGQVSHRASMPPLGGACYGAQPAARDVQAAARALLQQIKATQDASGSQVQVDLGAALLLLQHVLHTTHVAPGSALDSARALFPPAKSVKRGSTGGPSRGDGARAPPPPRLLGAHSHTGSSSKLKATSRRQLLRSQSLRRAASMHALFKSKGARPGSHSLSAGALGLTVLSKQAQEHAATLERQLLASLRRYRERCDALGRRRASIRVVPAAECRARGGALGGIPPEFHEFWAYHPPPPRAGGPRGFHSSGKAGLAREDRPRLMSRGKAVRMVPTSLHSQRAPST